MLALYVFVLFFYLLIEVDWARQIHVNRTRVRRSDDRGYCTE